MTRSAPTWVSALILAAAVLQVPSTGSATDELSAHWRRELQTIGPETPPREAGYAVKRTWDLVVLHRIRFPGSSPAALSDEQALANLRSYRDAHAKDLDPAVYGLIAALLGEYDAATTWLTNEANPSPGLPICGNAGVALSFGEEELRLYLGFLQGRYAEVTKADIVARRTNGVLWVNVRSDRMCLLYGIAAAAHEALGDDAAARHFALKADSLTSALQSSWNYYYPADSEMLAHIADTMRDEATRIRARSARAR
jgi:hypothetical protein